jgi:hypothetical protein
MSQKDWAKVYRSMDERIVLKYEQLPKGEQIGRVENAVQPLKGSTVQTPL